jgi:hypothetical protein
MRKVCLEKTPLFMAQPVISIEVRLEKLFPMFEFVKWAQKMRQNGGNYAKVK